MGSTDHFDDLRGDAATREAERIRTIVHEDDAWDEKVSSDEDECSIVVLDGGTEFKDCG